MKTVEPRRTVSEFSLFIEHAKQSSYVEVPFQMPGEVEEIRVSYTVETAGDAKAVIDLGLRDSSRVRGWSGGARSGFTVGLEKATPGYLPGPLTAGDWAVLHNAYKIPEDGCTVNVTIEFMYETPRWLKGDLHTHSINSDGKFTLEENAAIMEELGCDFIAMTDHNTASQNLSYPRNTSVVMIPGYEFTTNFGHSNFLGVTDPLDDFRVANQADVHTRLGTARERGAKIVLNHPHCDACPWEWDFEVDHDWVEVWNGPWTERNARALSWWQQQLVSGRRLIAIGGSDVHRPDPYIKHAMPCTWVLASTKTVGGILSGIEQGHVSITYSPEGPFLELECGSYLIGDVVPKEQSSRTVRLQAEDLIEGDIVKLISNHGVEREITVSGNAQGAWELNVEADQKTFIRAEVWRRFKESGEYLMAALTNPIYLD